MLPITSTYDAAVPAGTSVPAKEWQSCCSVGVRCATRGRLVDSGSGSNAPAVLPGHGPAARRPLPSTGSSRHEFPGVAGVGSEEARSVALTLASVRRSNGACGFPALRFHKGTLQA
jgi:hypothetical protein